MDAAVRATTEASESANEGLQVSEEWKTLKGVHCITGGITALVTSLGGTLSGHTRGQFPWKNLPKDLARLGYVLDNYPEETLMPGEPRVDLARTKGARDLTAKHRHNLINALKSETLIIRAVPSDAAHACLTSLEDPVIIGEAPSASSPHSHGRRMFADGCIDRHGLPRLTSNLHLHPSRRGRMHRPKARMLPSPNQSRNVEVQNNTADDRSGAIDEDDPDPHKNEDGDEDGSNDDENEGDDEAETENKDVESNDENGEDNYEADFSVHTALGELPASCGSSTRLSSASCGRIESSRAKSKGTPLPGSTRGTLSPSLSLRAPPQSQPFPLPSYDRIPPLDLSVDISLKEKFPPKAGLESFSKPDLSPVSEMLAKTCPPASQPSKSTILKDRVQISAPAARSQGDISLDLSNSPTVICGLPSSLSLPKPQPKRPHPVAHIPCALTESSSSSIPLHLATPNDGGGERQENNRKGKRKASIESVHSCKEDISTGNLRPTKHRKLIRATPVVHKHEQFWIPDGNTVLEVGGVLFKLHCSRLVDQSTFFAGLLDEHDVHVDDSVVVESDGNGTVYHLSNTTPKDLEALLQLDRNPTAYYVTPPPFLVLAAILRAATALGFETHRTFAVRLLENAWSSSLADLSTDKKPNAIEVVILARTCGIESVLKRAFYEMVRVRVVGYGLGDSELDGGNREGSQEISRTDERRLGRLREHLLLTWFQVATDVDNSFMCPNQQKKIPRSALGFSASTRPSSSTSLAHSSTCPSLPFKQLAWMKRVHNSGLYKEYPFDPLCGLQALIDIKWDEDENWCSDCVQAIRDVWTRMRQRTWEHVGVLMGLERSELEA